MSNICVAHLVRAQNGLPPFERFLESYRAHSVGAAHDLLIVFKAFGDAPDIQQYQVLLRGIPYQSLFADDSEIDVSTYLIAARKFDSKYFCFLNSFSVIQDEDWLGKMYHHIQRDGVGIVGATGSHESIYATLKRSLLNPRWTGAVLDDLKENLAIGIKFVEYSSFPPFPNYHVRTNAFLVSRELMIRIKTGAVCSKTDGYEFESGKNSLTRMSLNLDLRPLVVGRDGEAYEKEDWRESLTFRSGNQENLLVADNQTRLYDGADPKTRAMLTEITWGRR